MMAGALAAILDLRNRVTPEAKSGKSFTELPYQLCLLTSPPLLFGKIKSRVLKSLLIGIFLSYLAKFNSV